MQAELGTIRDHSTNPDIISEVKRNLEKEDEMITEFEGEVGELHKITKDEVMNVIAQQQITEIKAKLAQNSNNSVLSLADEQYNLSVLQQSRIENEPTIDNQSFIKKKTAVEESRK